MKIEELAQIGEFRLVIDVGSTCKVIITAHEKSVIAKGTPAELDANLLETVKQTVALAIESKGYKDSVADLKKQVEEEKKNAAKGKTSTVKANVKTAIKTVKEESNSPDDDEEPQEEVKKPAAVQTDIFSQIPKTEPAKAVSIPKAQPKEEPKAPEPKKEEVKKPVIDEEW